MTLAAARRHFGREDVKPQRDTTTWAIVEEYGESSIGIYIPARDKGYFYIGVPATFPTSSTCASNDFTAWGSKKIYNRSSAKLTLRPKEYLCTYAWLATKHNWPHDAITRYLAHYTH